VKRDRKRSVHDITGLDYRSKMHAAVCASQGRDFYTGEELAWELIGSHSNAQSKEGRSTYKAALEAFALGFRDGVRASLK